MPETVFKSVKGFKDILPEPLGKWRFIEETAAEVFALYGFSQMRTPVLEFTDIYTTGIGGSSDLVEKEMYSFEDRDGSQITLRPEGTAGVARAFIENSMHRSAQVQKLYYSGEMFRHERPQKGRMRGFHQIGAEFFGSDSPSADCEIIAMAWHFFTKAGLSGDVETEINSIGTPDDRKVFKNALAAFLKPFSDGLCDDCKRRLEQNPLRVLDCKNGDCAEITKDAPKMSEFLSPENLRHFEEVKERLEAVSVPFKVNERTVRGLDYYTRTVFEIKAKKGLGAQNAVCAGGRYDLLVETLGGPPTPATGFAIGVERAVLLLGDKADEFGASRPDVFFGWINAECFDGAFVLSAKLRDLGVKVRIEHSGSSVRSQMKKADKAGAGFMAIIGPDEMKSGTVRLRNMKTGEEKQFSQNRAGEIADSVKKPEAG